MKNSDIVALFLKELKIEKVFGIIGSANSHIFQSIHELGYTEIINVHHEQAAVMAMGAYHRASGKISASIVTAGAGAANAITGVVSNWADSIPGLVISGNESSYYIKDHKNLRMYGTQGFNIVKMVSDVTKYGSVILEDSDLQTELEKAFSYSITGRPGPTWIDIPFNIQSQESEIRDWNLKINEKHENFESNSLIELINDSKRPLILGGNGVRLSNAQKDFNFFVKKTGIPTCLSWSGINLLPSSDENFMGRFGIYGQRAANFIVQNSDLLIVLGSRLALPQTGYDLSAFANKAKIVIIDIEEELQIPKNKIAKHFKIDCKLFLEDLNNKTKGLKKVSVDWIKFCNKMKFDYPLTLKEYNTSNYINSYNFINSLSNYLKDEHIIVTDMGTALLSGHQSIKLNKNQKMFTSLGLGEMGYGLPGAIGAAFSSPNKDVLCLNCDGGIMMNIQELQTIIENDLNIKIVIFNNDGYLMIKHTQKMLFNGNYNSVNKKTGIGLPNFKKVFKAFGYDYFELREIENINDTLESFLNSKRQSVLEVFMDPEQDFIPKVKGVLMNDKTILSLPIEDMSPLLTLNEIENNMISGISEKSKIVKR
tara:strand:- start:2561 stop:4345 length:1785 start_codon:yes stop_codon:yes gene_type:complete